uniref:Uncharacterized protein n=1 Tax=Sphenodon punctatus TaxID=8508 RepID=A0A8D0GHM3_SPHPU
AYSRIQAVAAMDYSEEMDRDYEHGAYGDLRSMDSYLNQSYGMESHGCGGNRFRPDSLANSCSLRLM